MGHHAGMRPCIERCYSRRTFLLLPQANVTVLCCSDVARLAESTLSSTCRSTWYCTGTQRNETRSSSQCLGFHAETKSTYGLSKIQARRTNQPIEEPLVLRSGRAAWAIRRCRFQSHYLKSLSRSFWMASAIAMMAGLTNLVLPPQNDDCK